MDEVKRARGLQHMRSEMFLDLERRALQALDLVCKESVPSPLEPNDTGYLAFFTRIMERLEEGAERVGEPVKEEGRNLLARAATRVFSHLFRLDPDFDFDAMIAPVLRVVRGALSEWVEDHMDALIAEFASDGRGDQREAEGYETDDSDDDGASP